jgi:hypothetical protein
MMMMNVSRPLCRGATTVLQAPAFRSLSTLAPHLASTARPRLSVSKLAPLSNTKRFDATLASPGAPATPDFDPHAHTAMDKQTPPEPGADFNVVIVGA